jgi:hypothetical protein
MRVFYSRILRVYLQIFRYGGFLFAVMCLLYVAAMVWSELTDPSALQGISLLHALLPGVAGLAFGIVLYVAASKLRRRTPRTPASSDEIKK